MRAAIGKWTSPKDQASYANAYKAALRELPPAQSHRIDTSFGVVQSYYWKSDNLNPRHPVLLLPGRSSGTPMWRSNIPDLCGERTVYSFDALGYAGLSEQREPLRSAADQARWVHEAIEALSHPSLHLVGHSFGGWLAANYASYYPKQVESLLLIEPVITFQMIRLAILLKSIPFNMRFLPKKWRMGLLEEISGSRTIDTRDRVAKIIVLGADCFVSKLSAPKLIAKSQLRAWTFPTYVAMAEQSGVHDSRKAIEVAKKNVRSLAIELWNNATHSLPMEHPKELNNDMISFMDRVDRVLSSP